MSEQELYSFFLSLIVFVILTGFFTVLLAYSVKLKIALIRCGAIDKEIQKEYEKEKNKLRNDGWFVTLLSRIFAAVLCVVFAFSMILAFTENTLFEDIPTLKVVKSDSMSYKNKLNKYLFENELDDQFDTYDLILCEKLPDEFDLELYDIVIYDYKGTAIVHRIVEIIEPDETHPDHRYFRTQGDAVSSPDGSLVFYDHMLGVYEGNRIPFLGSIVIFLQSPAGWLCVILLLFTLIAAPIVENKLVSERLIRLLRSGYLMKKPVPTKKKVAAPAVEADVPPPAEDEPKKDFDYFAWAKSLREELCLQRDELHREMRERKATPPPVATAEAKPALLKEAEDRRLVAMFMQSLAAEEAAMQAEVARRVEERKAAMAAASARPNQTDNKMNKEGE